MKKVRHKHNKKRNTAFLYEALVRELTESVIKKDFESKKKVLSILKEFFKKGTMLKKELDIYKALYETKEVDIASAEKILTEAKKQHKVEIDKTQLFNEQTRLIKMIASNLSNKVFNNFIPNYRSIATVSQMFGDLPITDRVLLEQTTVRRMSTISLIKEEKEIKPVTQLAFKTFLKKFNESYGEELDDAQKKLLEQYVLSYSEDNPEFKIHMNGVISTIKEEIGFILENVDLTLVTKERIKKVYTVVEGLAAKPINKETISKVLKVQNLIKEVKQNVN